MINISLGCNIKGFESFTDKHLNHLTGIDLFFNPQLPFPTNSVDNIYITNILERLYDTSIIPLLKECYRVLKRRGILRICVTNSVLYQHAYQRHDREMFYDFAEYHKFCKDYHKADLDDLFLLTFATRFSALCGGHYTIGYPDHMAQEIKKTNSFKEAADNMGFDLAMNELIKQNGTVEGHEEKFMFTNWHTLPKLHDILLHYMNRTITETGEWKHDDGGDVGHGFGIVYVSNYGQSSCPQMRNLKFFDSDFPQGSLYIEALR